MNIGALDSCRSSNSSQYEIELQCCGMCYCVYGLGAWYFSHWHICTAWRCVLPTCAKKWQSPSIDTRWGFKRVMHRVLLHIQPLIMDWMRNSEASTSLFSSYNLSITQPSTHSMLTCCTHVCNTCSTNCCACTPKEKTVANHCKLSAFLQAPSADSWRAPIQQRYPPHA